MRDESPLSIDEEVPPAIVSLTRHSLQPLSAEGLGISSEAAGPQAGRYRSTVSYLQVERPKTQLFADEIRLRKGENGVYHIVQD